MKIVLWWVLNGTGTLHVSVSTILTFGYVSDYCYSNRNHGELGTILHARSVWVLCNIIALICFLNMFFKAQKTNSLKIDQVIFRRLNIARSIVFLYHHQLYISRCTVMVFHLWLNLICFQMRQSIGTILVVPEPSNSS